MKANMLIILHLILPCAAPCMEAPSPRSIKAWQKYIKQPKTLLSIAASVALKKSLSDSCYKQKLLALCADIQEKNSQNMPDFFQELLEAPLSTHPHLVSKMIPTTTRPFSMCPSGNYVCIRIPKKNDTVNEFEIIDYQTKQRIHCPKEISRNMSLIDGEEIWVHPAFKRAFSWIAAAEKIETIAQWLGIKTSKIVINKKHTAFLAITGQKIYYYDVPSRNLIRQFQNAFFLQTNEDCTIILFTDLATTGRAVVAELPLGQQIFTITHDQGLHPCIHPDGTTLATHKDNSISVWNMRGAITHRIEMPYSILDLHYNQIGTLNVKCKLPDHSLAHAIVNTQTGHYKTITDQELHDPRSIEVDENHTLAYYQTVHGQEKLWSFSLQKPIRVYYPKVIKEKAKIDDADSTKNYCLVPTHQIFKNKTLKELIPLVLGK